MLITGGAGFIGSNLVAALAERGEEVAVCDRLGADERWRNIAKHEVADLVAPDALPSWLRRHDERVAVVVHLGALSSTTETDVDRFVEQNIRPTLALWEWCAAARRPFLYASSAATYGDGSAGFEDDASPAALARLRPLNAYGWSKHFVDRRIARLLAQGAPAPPQWVGLKFFNVYGPNEYHKGPMMSVAAQNHARVHAGEPMRLFRSHRPDYPDGGQRRDFIYVRDCVDVMLWLIANPQVSGLFNLGTGRAATFNELAEALFAAVGRRPDIEYIDMPEAIRPRYQYHTEAAMGRLRAAGYKRPFTPLAEGIADYVHRYLESADPYR
ncbi:MAG: ADP-glyceromanno-heptose 6-epimerase [Rhodospirillaceae bacterium]|nr:ADP-glyceromanno-heptose 6-epimerase [Rhodospirillaceae bacterium]